MGHLGLTPQTATALGGYKAQGKIAQGGDPDARGRPGPAAVGCFAIVFEAVPAEITSDHRRTPRDPHDRHRRRPGDLRPGARLPRPARHHHRPHGEVRQAATPTSTRRWSTAVGRYGDEVRGGSLPRPEHVYAIDDEELADFRRYVDEESLASAKGLGVGAAALVEDRDRS